MLRYILIINNILLYTINLIIIIQKILYIDKEKVLFHKISYESLKQYDEKKKYL